MKTKGGEFKDIEWALDESNYLFDILKPREQFMVAMHFCCKKPYKWIAEYEGITENNVCQIMHRVNNRAKKMNVVNQIMFSREMQMAFKNRV